MKFCRTLAEMQKSEIVSPDIGMNSRRGKKHSGGVAQAVIIWGSMWRDMICEPDVPKALSPEASLNLVQGTTICGILEYFPVNMYI